MSRDDEGWRRFGWRGDGSGEEGLEPDEEEGLAHAESVRAEHPVKGHVADKEGK